MPDRPELVFPPFLLDRSNAQLWRHREKLYLRRKTFELLVYMADRAGQLVTKEQLLDAIWPDVVVSDSLPAVCVAELRKAMGDSARSPKIIETVPRRGYRFVASLTLPSPGARTPDSPRRHSEQVVVGRESELEQMRACYERALQGQRAVLFLSGEAGIGKTVLLRSFLDALSAGAMYIAEGQCIEQYGAGEPYMPVLEALNRLCHQTENNRVLLVLKQHAPTWLKQMPSLISADEQDKAGRADDTPTRLRMLREMTQALEVLTLERPVILAIEDLQWSDFSTLELIAMIARRSDPARLLVIGTYRTAELRAKDRHPLRSMKDELDLHQCCEEIRPSLLSAHEIGEYLENRFADERPHSLEAVAHAIHQRTEGNPLFMVNMVNLLSALGTSDLLAGQLEVPPSLQRLIERNLERLEAADQRLLEAASVVGMEFCGAGLAAVLLQEVGEVEGSLARLARSEDFIQPSGIANWPDGAVSSSFRFKHALYGEVLYSRVPISQRIEFHRRIAERQEEAFGEGIDEIAAELAHHYNCARQNAKALHFFEAAGRHALSRSASNEAIAHFRAALGIVDILPAGRERARQELKLYNYLQAPLIATTGYTSAEVERASNKARQICETLGETEKRAVPATLGGLISVYFNRGQLRLALEIAERLLHFAERTHDSPNTLWAHYSMGIIFSDLGENEAAYEHLEQCIALYDRSRSGRYGFIQDPGPTALLLAAVVLHRLGSFDRALAKTAEGLALARELAHPYTLSWVLGSAAVRFMDIGDRDNAERLWEEESELCTRYGFEELLEDAMIGRGGMMIRKGLFEAGIALIREGLVSGKNHRPHGLALLAEAYWHIDESEKGLEAIAKALERESSCDRRNFIPWLLQLKGLLLLNQNNQNQAIARQCLEEAIRVARTQNDKAQELETTSHLAHLLEDSRRFEEAHARLAKIYGEFSEGFDTPILRDAAALLKRMEASALSRNAS
ncbi:MAG TPA: AAA family ATPase [Candidatus Binataceae bacterium]|nr:AAA family ATPase [Candidatus Binataceae bacterium]